MLNNLKHPMFQYDHHHFQYFTCANLLIIVITTNIYMHLQRCITVCYYIIRRCESMEYTDQMN